MFDTTDRAITAICLFAALADGRTADAERERITTFCTELGGDAPELPRLCEDVFLGRASLATYTAALAGPLATDEQRRQAFDMAVCVCDADGATSAEERKFLEGLRQALSIPVAAAAASIRAADAIVENESVDLLGDAAVVKSAVRPPPPPAGGGSRGAASTTAVDTQAIDEVISRACMITAGLELLPQKLATVAILPLQARMVYRIGAMHGYQLDSGHIKEFIAAVGAGLASQTFERFARGLVGGLAGRMLGGMLGSISGVATGAAMTYATTYALGQVAKTYYASGRTISMDQLRGLFSRAVTDGRAMYEKNASTVSQQAQSLDVKQLLSSLGGGR